MEYYKNEFTISTDKRKLDIETIHGFLTTSYWAKDITPTIVLRGIEHSLCFGIYDGSKQIGFARVISDYTTFAYLADVFVIETYRGRGLSKWLMECIMNYPDLQGLRRWMLMTRDAHGLYEQYGFQIAARPQHVMEIARPTIYSEMFTMNN
ncbi:GNAT family N-acetyltransferase [bacterium]|nr:GNAT family N-acetyltransferase [bacterium]